MSKNIFVLGTDTDVGKTFVASLMMKNFLRSGKNPAYFKAAMSGGNDDALRVKKFPAHHSL